jgi:hypothetical protein
MTNSEVSIGDTHASSSGCLLLATFLHLEYLITCTRVSKRMKRNPIDKVRPKPPSLCKNRLAKPENMQELL